MFKLIKKYPIATLFIVFALIIGVVTSTIIIVVLSIAAIIIVLYLIPKNKGTVERIVKVKKFVIEDKHIKLHDKYHNILSGYISEIIKNPDENFTEQHVAKLTGHFDDAKNTSEEISSSIADNDDIRGLLDNFKNELIIAITEVNTIIYTNNDKDVPIKVNKWLIDLNEPLIKKTVLFSKKPPEN